ncbi:hypothetical protein [Pedobacter sp. Leaf250]|uniref:hypothetical protein n=1 Tax=Pedobacter sp. Leaf250 TaxID=2876559 RepID=UPI001E54EBF3|nr:hypothetical protein [Pedobacter sp. Leaf250]
MLWIHSKISRVWLVAILIFCCQFKTSGQQIDSLASVISEYGKQNATSNLFVHFDKNIYSNNDQVWFTSYLLQAFTPISNYHTLYVALVNNVDSSIVNQHKFLIHDGYSFGDFLMPDSLPSGSYRFVVNTNIKVKGTNDPGFIQPISIKSTTKNLLVPQVSIFKSFDEETRTGTALLKILTSDNRFIENAEIKYTIGRDQIIKSGVAKSSVIGELMIDFPADKIDAGNNLLNITIKKDNQIRYIKYELPILNQRKFEINFYPESGYLVNGLLSKVGVEIKDLTHAAVKVKAVLLEDNEVIDTINTNSMGLGFFSIVPNINSKYSFKILTINTELNQYDLPKILKDGVVINVKDVIANKDFRLKLQSSFDTKIHVVVHNYNAISLHSEMVLKKGLAQNVRLDLDSVPIGLNTITILNSEFKPLTERIFFSHYNDLNELKVSTDKAEYELRDSVKLSIKASASNKNSSQGLVSISCTQTNRFSTLNNMNIVDYAMLEKELVKLPVNPMGIKITDRDYLNNILTVKGWRRYKWPLYKDSISKGKVITSEEITGQIRKGKKKVTLPMQLFAIAKSNVHTIESDSNGRFMVPYTNLITENKNEVWVSLNKNASDYNLIINDPAEELKKNIRKQPYEAEVFKSLLPSDNQVFADPGGNTLKEVTIKNIKSDGMQFAKNGYMNSCGDYVCPSNILNCMNHFGNASNKMPREGAQYRNQGGGTSVYHGCEERKKDPNITILSGIKFGKEFYKFNLDNKEELINVSTIFWDYQKTLNQQGEANLTFTTGDLTGSFKIIVQGVTTNGPVYGEQYITIKRP